jgi:hypothetical protein
MDPLMHLMLPMLLLLALRIEPRKVVMFAPLAILVDLDALFGLHRALFHSFIPVLVLPAILLAYSRLKRPEWMLSSVLVMFYLVSHVVLDLGGVAFLWPFVHDQFYLDPQITFTASDGVDIGFSLEYGMKPLEPMGTTSLLSDYGFGLIFLGVFAAVVFRKEALGAFRGLVSVFKGLLSRFTG